MANNVINKARNWWAVLYPENMIEGWQDKLYRLLQVPFEYVIHDKDEVEIEEDVTQPRKIHVHMVLHFSNSTTYKHAFELFNLLSKEGCKCLNKIEAVIYLKYAHCYLVHRTPECIKAGKHLYEFEDIVSGNNWDLGAFTDLEEGDKLILYRSLRNAAFEYDLRSCIMLEKYVEDGLILKDIDISKNDIILYIKNNRRAFESICKEVNYEKSKKCKSS